jgi:hypothetical protein
MLACTVTPAGTQEGKCPAVVQVCGAQSESGLKQPAALHEPMMVPEQSSAPAVHAWQPQGLSQTCPHWIGGP